jgi:hypothetical protein
MSLLGRLFDSSVGEVIDKTGKAIDSLITSDEEKLILKNKLVEIKGELELKKAELVNQYEEQITRRWEADSKSDTLTKRIRPMFLMWVMMIITVMIFGDAIGYQIKEAYIGLIETLATTAVVAYFGSRGVEKGVQIWKQK